MSTLTLQQIKQKATEEYIKRTTHKTPQSNISIEDGKIYELISTMVDSISASLTAGGGEVNTASNIGTTANGEGVFAQKVGVDLEFKRLKAGNYIDIKSSASAVDISVSGLTGQANTMSNIGTGEGVIYKEKIGDNLILKTLKAGNNVTITNNINEIIISAVSIATVVNMYLLSKSSIPSDIYNFTVNLGTSLI